MFFDFHSYIFQFLLIVIGSSAFYSLTKGRMILDLFQDQDQPLTDAEKVRLDRLLESCKQYHNLSLIVSGILMALSTLSVFQFEAPFGGIVFPKVQTTIGLFLLVVVLLIIADRFFLMAYPWLRIDDRRPPFAWGALGLAFERSLVKGGIFNLPLLISALATSIILRDEPQLAGALTYGALWLVGFGLIYLPRTIYFWSYLISERVDHRGGSATFSIYLLYIYRLIRQVMYGFFLISIIALVMPRWSDPQFNSLIGYAVVIFGVLYIARMVCGIRALYIHLDKLGRRFGFPTESKHYK